MRVLLAVIGLTCCGSSMGSDTPEEAVPFGTPFEAIYQNAQGDQLEVPTNRTLVLAYSGKFCSACNAEAKDWVNYLKGKDPKKVKIMTLSISDSPSVTQKWKQSLGASWEFGTPADESFSKYCPKNLVPCVLVVKEGKVVFTEYGNYGHAKIEQYSGKWE